MYLSLSLSVGWGFRAGGMKIAAWSCMSFAAFFTQVLVKGIQSFERPAPSLHMWTAVPPTM